MANKAIKQYNQTTATQTGSATDDKDALLLQRGSNYFWIDPVDARLGLQKVELTITEAEIEALNSAPQTIVAAQGAGTYIEPVDAYIVRDAGSAYGTNQTVRMKFNAEIEANYHVTWNAILAETTKKVKVGDFVTNDNYFLIENTAFEVFVPSGDPTSAGTGSITVVLFYRIISA